MVTRFYVNNFRCLVAFEMKFAPFGVLCGPNGGGKSSIFDALACVQDIASGTCYLGDVAHLEFTSWLDSRIQEFELSIEEGEYKFEYLIHIEQLSDESRPQIRRERATCNGKELFERDSEGVRFTKSAGKVTGFPLDRRRAALGSIQPSFGDRKEIELLQKAIAGLLILKPNPRSIERESRAEAHYPDRDMSNAMSWYRFLSQEQDWLDNLRESLQEIWPDFKSFKMENVGISTKALQLRFQHPNFLHELSDGEKMLFVLYMLRSALATGAISTVFIDEPDNFVGLPEIQPWVISLQELLNDQHQAILISHHPEILNSVADEHGYYVWRENHASPTRTSPLIFPDGISPGEALARGWVHG